MARRVFIVGLFAMLGLLALLAGASSGAPKPGGTADLALTKSDSPDPVSAGAPLTYTIQVTNNGPEDAGNVVVTDDLPNQVTFVSAGSTQGSCGVSANKRKVTCSLGTVAVPVGPAYTPTGATVTINVLAPTKSGTIPTRPRSTGTRKTRKKAITPPARPRVWSLSAVPTCRGRQATIVGTPSGTCWAGPPATT